MSLAVESMDRICVFGVHMSFWDLAPQMLSWNSFARSLVLPVSILLSLIVGRRSVIVVLWIFAIQILIFSLFSIDDLKYIGYGCDSYRQAFEEKIRRSESSHGGDEYDPIWLGYITGIVAFSVSLCWVLLSAITTKVFAMLRTKHQQGRRP